jgi:hypothetical protein
MHFVYALDRYQSWIIITVFDQACTNQWQLASQLRQLKPRPATDHHIDQVHARGFLFRCVSESY